MLVIDSHLDLAWDALQWNRNIEQPAYDIRIHERTDPGKGRAQNTVSLPDLRRGRVALCFATMLARCTGTPVAHVDFRTPEQAYGVARGQLAYYRALEQGNKVRIITDLEALDRHMEEWTAWDAAYPEWLTGSPTLGFVISMESADAILSPEQLPEWWDVGLRVLGPAHYGPGRYTGGTASDAGLNAMGESLILKMDRLGILLDMSHFTDLAFWEALACYQGPVLASHNNCRALVPHQRQFSDAQLGAIFERDGVIGVACDAWMLQPGWVVGHTTNERVTLANVVDHIDHICQLSSSSRHAAIGSDLDGGFGREQAPNDLDTIADLQKIGTLLADRGYNPDDVKAIMYGNWLDLLRRCWTG